MELHAAADVSTQPPRTEIGLQDMDSDAISQSITTFNAQTHREQNYLSDDYRAENISDAAMLR